MFYRVCPAAMSDSKIFKTSRFFFEMDDRVTSEVSFSVVKSKSTRWSLLDIGLVGLEWFLGKSIVIMPSYNVCWRSVPTSTRSSSSSAHLPTVSPTLSYTCLCNNLCSALVILCGYEVSSPHNASWGHRCYVRRRNSKVRPISRRIVPTARLLLQRDSRK